MFAPAFEVIGMQLSDWRRLTGLLPLLQEGPPGSTGIVALGRRGHHVGLWRVTGTRLVLSETEQAATLEQLAKAHGAAWAARVHPSALEELLERCGARLSSHHDSIEQWLLCVSIVAELVSESAISLWPRSLVSSLGLINSALRSSINALCPEGKAVLVGIFDDSGLYACLGLMRGSAGVERVLGPGAVRDRMGLLSGDWRRDYVHLVNAFELDHGPVAAGIFTTRSTLTELLHNPTPGAWSSAVAASDVVLQPINPLVAIPLGIDAGRAALATVSQLAAKVAEVAPGPEALAPALSRFKQVAKGEQDVRELLGFDPLKLLSSLFDDNKRH